MFDANLRMEETMQARWTRSSLISGVLLVAAFWVPRAAAQAKADDRSTIVAVVHRIMDAFNKGDIPALKSLVEDDFSILDDMPPFVWRGPAAMDVWLGDVDKDNRLNKDADGVSIIGPPTFIRVEGGQAYVVFPDKFSYKRNERQIRENATATFVLRKTDAGWRVVSIAYAADRH